MLAVITGAFSSGLVIIKAIRSPISEMKLLASSIVLYTLGFFFFVPSTVLNSEYSEISLLSIQFYRIGSLIVTIGLLLTYLSIVLPIFRIEYHRIVKISIAIMVFITSAILNLRIDLVMQEDRLLIIIDPLVLLFILLSQGILVTSLVLRILQINRLKGGAPSPFNSFRSLILVSIFAIIASISVTIPVFNPQSVVPTYSNALFTSLVFLVFSASFYHDETFLFISPAKFEAVLISLSHSGLTLYSETRTLEMPPEDFITTIFTWMNISLKDTTQNSGNIEEIRYGNRVILVRTGQLTTTFFITTDKNFITITLADFISKRFEERYMHKLQQTSNQIIDRGEFEEIHDDIAYVKHFML